MSSSVVYPLKNEQRKYLWTQFALLPIAFSGVDQAPTEQSRAQAARCSEGAGGSNGAGSREAAGRRERPAVVRGVTAVVRDHNWTRTFTALVDRLLGGLGAKYGSLLYRKNMLVS